MMKPLLLAVLFVIVPCLLAQQQVPTISDSYAATIEIDRPDCPTNHLNPFPCPNSETFFEIRDYDRNRMKIVHSHWDQYIYHFDRQTSYYVNQWNCTTTNVTQQVVQHHGWYFDGQYDPTTGHLRPANDYFRLSSANFTYAGQSQARGIFTDTWSAQTIFQFNASYGVQMNYIWHFSAQNWTFMSLDVDVRVAPVQMAATFKPYNIVNGQPVFTGLQFHEYHNWLDYRPGSPDYEAWKMDAFCAELIQQPIPTLPSQYAHVVENNDLRRRESSSGTFLFDYDANRLRFSQWVNDADVHTLVDVANMKSYTFSWNGGCQVSSILPPQPGPGPFNRGEWYEMFIDFTTNPPHLKQLTETVGYAPPNSPPVNWLYGGHRLVRDVESVMWFYSHNFTLPRPFDGITQVFEIVAWYFTAPGWQMSGLPDESVVPIRVSRIGQALNVTNNQLQFFTEHREFVDVKIGLEPRIVDVPSMCPGGVSRSESSSGLNSGGAAGLAIGMIILGALLGVGGLMYYQRRQSSSRMSVQDSTEENVSLSGKNSYGSVH